MMTFIKRFGDSVYISPTTKKELFIKATKAVKTVEERKQIDKNRAKAKAAKKARKK